MSSRPTRSLKHEYELFIENELENYKDSIPRSALLAIGDEAVSRLSAEPQLALTEMLLCEEVDRIITRRLRLPSYQTWRRRRLKLAAEMRRPEHWGLQPTDILVRAVAQAEGHVLVADATEAPALYLAAQGCEVTTLAAEEDALERVLAAAASAGFGSRVQGQVTDLGSWTPDGAPLTAVVCTAAAFETLAPGDRARVIAVLQSATADGGVHLVKTLAAGRAAAVTLEELRARYVGWDVWVEREAGQANSFLARKAVS